ncbi:MAG: HipA family kinase, partial [Dehalococcoidia bacterium]
MGSGQWGIIPAVTGVRYVVPLREGGSLPAVVETDARQACVVKFRGAGQGAKALVAELLAAGLALVLGLP